MMKNPEEYCIKCGEGYGPFEDKCRQCGFNPCDGGEDEAAQTKAEKEYTLQQREQAEHDRAIY